MKARLRKALSYFLAIALVIAMVPGLAMPVQAGLIAFNIADGDIIISPGASSGFNVTQGGITSPDRISISITGTTTSNKIVVEDGATANITLNNLSIDLSGSSGCAFELQGTANVTLTLSGTNTLKSGTDSAGLQVPDGTALTIEAGSTGSLTATGGSCGAGIGGKALGMVGGVAAVGTVGTITINGGTVTATGGDGYSDPTYGSKGGGAGIGSGGTNSYYGQGPDSGTIIINGGAVTATGGSYTGTVGGNNGGGAGLGGGGYRGGGTITITGGTVTATGSDREASGIGSGYGGASGTITISGGTVTAKGSTDGAAIGGRNYGSTPGIITISGGTVTALGGQLGIYNGGSLSTITIDSGAILIATSTSNIYSAVSTENTTYAGTAYVLMANFITSKTGVTATEVYASGSPTASASLTPNRDYESIAFTVPGTGTYSLKTNGVTQQYYDYIGDTKSTAFTVSGTGLTTYTGVEDVTGSGDTTAPTLSAISSATVTVGTDITVTSSEDGTLYLVPKGTYVNKTALDAVTTNKATTACTANNAASLSTTGLTAGTYQVYAVDAADNVSAASADITLTGGSGGGPDGLTTTGGNANYIPSGSAIVVDSGLTLAGISGNIEGATVMVRNFAAGDVLTYPAQIGNITGSYNTSTGVLTLSGADTQANYQTALRTIKFSTTSGDLTNRLIDFSVGGGLYYAPTGHFYEYVDSGVPITWDAAEAAAEARDLFGRQGYLVTLTSDGENSFVQAKTSGLGWIGAKDINHPAGDWRWVTGPEGLEDSGNGLAFWAGYTDGSAVGSNYTHWWTGEPNNFGGTEYAAHMFGPGSSNAGYWNDYAPTNSGARGYIVEYGGMPGDNPLNVVSTKTVLITNNPSGGGGGGGSRTSSLANTGVDILVNGKTENAGTATTGTIGTQIVTTITVDQQKLEQKLAAEGNNAVITIPVNTKSDVVIGELNGLMVKNMETRKAVVVVKTETAAYTLPAQHINIDAISRQIGTQVALQDIKVQIEIAKAAAETAQVVENSAKKGEFLVVAPPVEFNVKCTYGDKTVEVSSFNAYVERTIAIPDGVDPNKITTGVIVDPDGMVRHVPTKITTIDGKYYAVINSLTNSAYSVIWHPLEFKDADNHWAKDAINDMGSRMVVSGVGNDLYEPDRDITRAEFAAIIVRALGLQPGTGNNPFADVKNTDWYCDYIKTATEYNIISGYNADKFGPMDKITREQAMTMIAKAMEITGLKAEFAGGGMDELLAGFADAGKSADYAKNSIAACVKTGIVSGRNGNMIAPKANITRAEVAVIVRSLLQKSGLI